MITKFIYKNIAIFFQKNDLWLHTYFQVAFKDLSKPKGTFRKIQLDCVWIYANCCFVAKEKVPRGILLKTWSKHAQEVVWPL